MLEYIVHTISKSVSHLVVASGTAKIQEPNLGDVTLNDELKTVCRAIGDCRCTNVPDSMPDCGPLEGIRVGLEFLAPECEFAFVTACDTPVFNAAVFEALLDKIGNHEAAIPVDGARVFGLTSVYRTDVHKTIQNMIGQGKRRVSELSSELDAILVPSDSLKYLDPDLAFLKNINNPTDYFEFLESIGEDCDPAFRKFLAG